MSPHLTLTQHHVIALMSAGATVTAAAQQAGVHRNTIRNWLRLSDFRAALTQACDEQVRAWRDQSQSLAAGALASLRNILDDPAVPPAVRLKAALALRGRTPPKPSPPPQPAARPGRNQLCPCGSGRKYKRCCMSRR